MTDESAFLQAQIHAAGISPQPGHMLTAHENGHVRLSSVASGRVSELACETLILVTGRLPDDRLHGEISAQNPPFTLARVGDCLQPSSIADAVYSAHRFAREFGAEPEAILRRERPPV